MSELIYTWINSHNDVEIRFFNENGIIRAELFSKHKGEIVRKTKVDISGDNIMVERENLISILKGNRQVTHSLSNINHERRVGIVRSLVKRRISIDKTTYYPEVSLVIHAPLP